MNGATNFNPDIAVILLNFTNTIHPLEERRILEKTKILNGELENRHQKIIGAG